MFVSGTTKENEPAFPTSVFSTGLTIVYSLIRESALKNNVFYEDAPFMYFL